jgi:hypothetical protein
MTLRDRIELFLRICLYIGAGYTAYRWVISLNAFYEVFKSVKSQEQVSLPDIDFAIFETLACFTFPLMASAIWLLAYLCYRVQFPPNVVVQLVLPQKMTSQNDPGSTN